MWEDSQILTQFSAVPKKRKILFRSSFSVEEFNRTQFAKQKKISLPLQQLVFWGSEMYYLCIYWYCWRQKQKWNKIDGRTSSPWDLTVWLCLHDNFLQSWLLSGLCLSHIQTWTSPTSACCTRVWTHPGRKFGARCKLSLYLFWVELSTEEESHELLSVSTAHH